VPKSKIIAVGRNVILGMDYPQVFQYRVDRNAPLPTGETVERLGDEEEARKKQEPSATTNTPDAKTETEEVQ
jgi:hypothetical protein